MRHHGLISNNGSFSSKANTGFFKIVEAARSHAAKDFDTGDEVLQRGQGVANTDEAKENSVSDTRIEDASTKPEGEGRDGSLLHNLVSQAKAMSGTGGDSNTSS